MDTIQDPTSPVLDDLTAQDLTPRRGKNITLTPDERRTLGADLVALYNKAKAARETAFPDLDARIEAQNKAYMCRSRINLGTFPLRAPGGTGMSADFHPSIPHQVMSVKLAQWTPFLTQEQPYFVAKPGRSDAKASDEETRADAAEQNMDARLRYEVGYEPSMTRVLERLCWEPVAIAHVVWRTRREMVTQRYGSLKETTVYDNVAIEPVPIQQFHLWPADAPTPAKADSLFHSYSLPLIDLKLDRAKSEPKYVIDPEDWECIVKGRDGNSKTVAPENKAAAEASTEGVALDCVDVEHRHIIDGKVYRIQFTVSIKHSLVIKAVPAPCGPQGEPTYYPFWWTEGGDSFLRKTVMDVAETSLTMIRTAINRISDATTQSIVNANTVVCPSDSDIGDKLADGWGGVIFASGVTKDSIWQPAQPVFAYEAAVKQLDMGFDLLEREVGITPQMMAHVTSGAPPTAYEVNQANSQGNDLNKHSIELLIQSARPMAGGIAHTIHLNAPETFDYVTKATDAERDTQRQATVDKHKATEQALGTALEYATGGQGVLDEDGPAPLDIKEPPATRVRHGKASDFAPGLFWDVNGSGPGMNKGENFQQALGVLAHPAFMAWWQEHPDHPEWPWEALAFAVKNSTLEDPARIIGPKPTPQEIKEDQEAKAAAAGPVAGAPGMPQGMPTMGAGDSMQGGMPQPAPMEPMSMNGAPQGVDPVQAAMMNLPPELQQQIMQMAMQGGNGPGMYGGNGNG